MDKAIVSVIIYTLRQMKKVNFNKYMRC